VIPDHFVAAVIFKAALWYKFLIRPSARASNVASSAPPPPHDTFASPGGVEAMEETAGEFQCDEELAVTSKVTLKGDVQVMNATIENVSIIDINNVPNFNINFRRCVDVDGEGEVSLRGGQDTPPGVKYINFSLMIPSNIAHHCNLRGIYASKRAHGLVVNEPGVSVADFFCVVQSAPKLDTTTLVSHFGLQPAESDATGRVFAFKNAAVQTGPVFPTSCTHKEVDIVVDPDVFEANAMCPFSRALQPSYLIVNDAAIRFKIGNLLVNMLLPHLMMNNTMLAMISVAMVTLLGHNYTEIVSGGVSVVNLFPCAWLYSTLANTGKTTALNLGQSCMGTKLIMTSGSTIPHARVRAGQSGGLGVVVLDDYSPAKMEEFAVFIRAVAGEGDEGRVNTMGTYVGNRQTAYAFLVNIYLVLTHIPPSLYYKYYIIYTPPCYLQANHVPADPPSHSRLITFNFKKVDPELYPQDVDEPPQNATGILSMLAPDFLNVLVNSQGVRDCAEFVSQVTGLHRSRSDANAALVLWATLYFKRMFTVSPLSNTFQVPTLLYFANEICSASVQQAQSDETSILARFVRHMSACMHSIDPMSAGSMFLGPHNIRTVFHDNDLEILKGGDYVYIKVDQVVNVLARQGVKYKARDIINSIKEEGPHNPHKISIVRGRWHNIAEYPVWTRRIDVGLQTEHLMSEDDIPSSQYVGKGNGYVISKKWFDSAVSSETAQDAPKVTEDDITKICLKNGDVFAELVHDPAWIGYGDIRTPNTGWDPLDPATQPSEILRKYSKTLDECVDRGAIDAANAPDSDTEE